MQITTTRYGVLPQQLQKNIEFQFISIEDGLRVLAESTRDQMRLVIKNKTYRDGSTGNLARAIDVEQIPNGFGVGNVNRLSQEAPYWYLMNYGGYSTIAARGISIYGYYGSGFRPNAAQRGSNPGAGTQGFTTTSRENGGFRMTPTAPVTAKNYIEDTANWASTAFRIHFSGLNNRVKLFR